MANYKTGAQRYNDRMDKIFKRSEELGNHTLHGSTEGSKKKFEDSFKGYHKDAPSHLKNEAKKLMAKKMKTRHHPKLSINGTQIIV